MAYALESQARHACVLSGELSPFEAHDFMETEPPCLFISLGREQRLENNSRPVSFPQRLTFLRTGIYEFAGAIFHAGECATSGHYTAVCVLDRDANSYARFDDDKKPVGKAGLS